MKIKKIYKEKFSGIVYNLHCTPNENYFSHNVLVHNCYKSNTPNGKYMSFDTFKKILDKFPHTIDPKTGKKIFVLSQVAFGVDAECKTNPDVWKIFKYCRQNGIVPNLTVASVNDGTAKKIAKYCGACAVSRYDDKDVCYDTVALLSQKYGMRQINIHQLTALESLNNIWETLRDIKTDNRLKNLNAIVFLSLKKKGRGINLNPLPQEEFTKIVKYCMDNHIPFGSDSCGAGKVLKSLTAQQYEDNKNFIEPCESSVFSFYCDVNGMYYPCSFMANEGDWKEGIDMLNVGDFMKEIWNNPKTISFRQKVCDCNKNLGGCSYFKV